MPHPNPTVATTQIQVHDHLVMEKLIKLHGSLLETLAPKATKTFQKQTVPSSWYFRNSPQLLYLCETLLKNWIFSISTGAVFRKMDQWKDVLPLDIETSTAIDLSKNHLMNCNSRLREPKIFTKKKKCGGFNLPCSSWKSKSYSSFQPTLPETNVAPENGWLEY